MAASGPLGGNDELSPHSPTSLGRPRKQRSSKRKHVSSDVEAGDREWEEGESDDEDEDNGGNLQKVRYDT